VRRVVRRGAKRPPPSCSGTVAPGASADGASDGRVESPRRLFKGGDAGSSSSGSKSDEPLSLSCFALRLPFVGFAGLGLALERTAYALEELAVSGDPIEMTGLVWRRS
jgi:hypothetical protein